MDKKTFLIIFAGFLTLSHGQEPSNYDISRNSFGGRPNGPNGPNSNGFGLRDILDYLVGGGYGSYYPGYPSGNYPGSYPGNYPGHHGPPGPPGDHPGCPLCDSSVYSYCSYKQAHDYCCCNPSYGSYNCRKSDCSFLYANSCEEFNLISSCCCVDLQKNAIEPAAV